MGINANMTNAASIETNLKTDRLLVEQIETNRLLRKLAGEPERMYPVSHAPKWHEPADPNYPTAKEQRRAAKEAKRGA